MLPACNPDARSSKFEPVIVITLLPGLYVIPEIVVSGGAVSTAIALFESASDPVGTVVDVMAVP